MKAQESKGKQRNATASKGKIRIAKESEAK